MLPLFDEPSQSGFDRQAFAGKLRELADQGIYIGGSSWKYEGWVGQIYTRDRYLWNGKFSRKRFEQNCLSEYAESFPIVGGDFSFYQFPTPEFWAKLFASAPRTLQFGLKVPEEITVKQFPLHPRYGPKAGLDNPLFLNAEYLEASLLSLLEPYRDQVSVLMFEFGTFSREAYERVDEFLRDLDAFLAALPRSWSYAVEIRNPGFLASDYFGMLAKHGIAHVFNAWTRMPALSEQIEIPGAFTADFIVLRGLLRQGRAYEEAVRQFSPYSEIQDPNPETRHAVRAVIEHAKQRRIPAYLFINNRLEGNAPGTIQAIVEDE